MKSTARSTVKFYIIKLFLLFLIAACAAVVAFLAKTIVAPFESIFYRVIINGIPMVFFFYFMYTVESRIKVPEEKEKLSGKYFLVFSLRELSVYAIFLIPLFILITLDSGFILSDGLLSVFYAPHSLFLHLLEGVPSIVSVLIPVIIFGTVACIAHYNTSKKPIPEPDASVSDEDDDSNDYIETEDDGDDQNDNTAKDDQSES